MDLRMRQALKEAAWKRYRKASNLRTVLSRLGGVEAMELLIDTLGKTMTNQDFLNAMSEGL